MIYSGSLVLLHLKLNDEWHIIGGMRDTRLEVSSQLIDATHNNSGAWRELLPDSGLRYVNITGSGAFTDSEAEKKIQELVFLGKIAEYRLEFANSSSLTGDFQISHYERFGNVNSEENYVISLASSGKIIFDT